MSLHTTGSPPWPDAWVDVRRMNSHLSVGTGDKVGKICEKCKALVVSPKEFWRGVTSVDARLPHCAASEHETNVHAVSAEREDRGHMLIRC